MRHKNFDLEAYFSRQEGSYEFFLDYGNASSSYFKVSKNDDIFISFGNSSYPDYEETKKVRKRDLLNFLKKIFGDGAKEIVEIATIGNVKGAFLKVKEFIRDNNIKVTRNEEIGFKSDESNYESKCFYDEGIGMVSFFIKSGILDDCVGIKIYLDGTFSPIISTKHINLADYERKRREKLIKDFIYETLKIKIDFEYAEGYKPLCIPELVKRSVSYAKINGTITYTDDNDDVYKYKDGMEISEVSNKPGKL